jgi:hypothetical protein
LGVQCWIEIHPEECEGRRHWRPDELLFEVGLVVCMMPVVSNVKSDRS